MPNNSIEKAHVSGLIYLIEQLKEYFKFKKDITPNSKSYFGEMVSKMEDEEVYIGENTLRRFFKLLDDIDEIPKIGYPTANKLVQYYSKGQNDNLKIFCIEFQLEINEFLADENYPILDAIQGTYDPIGTQSKDNGSEINQLILEIDRIEFENRSKFDLLIDNIIKMIKENNPHSHKLISRINSIQFQGDILTSDQGHLHFFNEGKEELKSILIQLEKNIDFKP